MTLTAVLFVGAGVGAGGLMFSDRLTDVWRSQDWAEPSAAWMALFNDRASPNPFSKGKVESAISIAPQPIPVLQEAPRRLEAESISTRVASAYPATTSSLSAAPVNARDLPWLPEAEKRAEPLESGPAPLLARVAVASPEGAPIKLPGASPAPSSPIAADVLELIDRARGHVERGDIAGARLLLERAASGSEPSALMALGETYDPAMLSKWGARGLKGDPSRARMLYQKAAESGLAEAKARVLALR